MGSSPANFVGMNRENPYIADQSKIISWVGTIHHLMKLVIPPIYGVT